MSLPNQLEHASATGCPVASSSSGIPRIYGQQNSA
jgi:hypothetical protein